MVMVTIQDFVSFMHCDIFILIELLHLQRKLYENSIKFKVFFLNLIEHYLFYPASPIYIYLVHLLDTLELVACAHHLSTNRLSVIFIICVQE